MPTEQTLFFTCPHCDELAQVEEPDRDIHTGETYHCGSCGIQVVFQERNVPDPGHANTEQTLFFDCGPTATSGSRRWRSR